ncbi:MAG: UTP--glucose-1-phosphate uridylyltransferase [Bacilli bacterium]
MENTVKFAVIPCAGRGTRFLPVSKGCAKEMLNIVDKPTLDYIVNELVDSGITDIVFIVSEGKDEIKKYYSRDVSYENELIKAGKKEYADMIMKISEKANFHYVNQKELLGLGHAVLQAKEVIGKNDFVVCCGDDIVTYKGEAPTRQLINAFLKADHHTIVGGQKVAPEMICKYGSMDIKKDIDGKLFELKGEVEKPKMEEAPSFYASLGKWVFNYHIFDALESTPKGKGGEIQLTDAISLLMKTEKVYFYDFVGKRYDCGDKLGFVEAVIDIALNREDIGEQVKEHIKSLKL